MAGIFTPQAPEEMYSAQPTPDTSTGEFLNAAANLGNSLFGGGRRASATDGMDIDIEPALRTIAAQEASGQMDKARYNETKLLANLRRAGVELTDSKVGRLYESIVGRPFEYAGLDDMQAVMIAQRQTPEWRNARLSTEVISPEMSPDDKNAMADTILAQRAAREQELLALTQLGELGWRRGGNKIVYQTIDEQEETMVGGLVALQNTGQPVSQGAIQDALASHTLFSNKVLSQMLQMNVPQAELDNVRKRLEMGRQFLSDLEKRASAGTLKNDLMVGIADAYLASGTTQGVFMAGSVLGMEGLTDLIVNGTVNMADLPDIAARVTPLLESFQRGAVISDSISRAYQRGGAGTTSSVSEMAPTWGEVPAEQKRQWEALDPDEAFKTLSGLGAFTSAIRMDTPEDQDRFFRHAGSVATGLMRLGQDDAEKQLDVNWLRKNVSPAFVGNIQRLAQADPQDGIPLASYVYGGVSAINVRTRARVEMAEQELPVVWENGRYRLDDQSLSVLADSLRIAPTAMAQFRNLLENRYGGDIVRMSQEMSVTTAGENQEIARLIRSTGMTNLADFRKMRQTVDYTAGVMRDLEAIRPKKQEGARVSGKQFSGLEDIEPSPVAEAILPFVDETEARGDYGALFGFANREGARFSGKNITEMTLAELDEFTKPSGDYGQFVKEEIGRVSTPLGRYQIVGSTLRALTKKLGLSPDTKFTPEVQDAMFMELVRGRLARAGGDVEKVISELRKEWEGLGKVSDAELRSAVESVMTG